MLLLDSHILLWYAEGDARLTTAAQTAIQNAKELYFSAASIWELTLKMQVGKLTVRNLRAHAVHLGCFILPITADHAESILNLPRHHNDPFDHLLLAQAKVEGLTLVTHDRILGEYGVPVLLV